MTMILNSRKQGGNGGKSVDVAPCSNANQLGFTVESGEIGLNELNAATQQEHDNDCSRFTYTGGVYRD